MKFQITVYRIFLLLLFLGFQFAYAQIAFRDQPRKYYEALIENLNQPDSIFIYEINSNWGSGIAYFVSFKKSCIKTGYYLNNNFIYRTLKPRGLMPDDSLNTIFRIVENKMSGNTNRVIESFNKIFQLPDEKNINDHCLKDIIEDGTNFQVSKISDKANMFKSYYEIYTYSKMCPHVKEYRKLVEIDKNFKHFFPSSKSITENLISAFAKRKKISVQIKNYFPWFVSHKQQPSV